MVPGVDEPGHARNFVHFNGEGPFPVVQNAAQPGGSAHRGQHGEENGVPLRNGHLDHPALNLSHGGGAIGRYHGLGPGNGLHRRSGEGRPGRNVGGGDEDLAGWRFHHPGLDADVAVDAKGGD